MMKRFFSLLALLLFCAWCSLLAQPITITPPVAYIDQGESVTLTASGATYYLWNPASGLSNTEGPAVVASPAVTTTYTVTGYNPSSTELVVNGDFEQGNVGFYTDYTYGPEGSSGLGFGRFVVTTDAEWVWQQPLYGMGGTGQFMLVDGAEAPNSVVWQQTITVTPNTYYAFSTQVASTCNSYVAGSYALLQFSVNGVQLGPVFHSPSVLNIWQPYYEVWYSDNNTSATLTILNQNNNGDGNDFGLDDISFRALELVDDGQCTVYLGTPEISLPDNIDSAACTVLSIGHNWGIEMDWSSTEYVSPLVIPLVGDINGDAVPEIVCFAPDNGYNFYGVTEVKVYNSITHSVIHTFNLPSAVSTVEGAPYGIIKLHNGHVVFVVVMMDFSMQAYDLTAMSTSPLWTVMTDYEAPNVGFADFNGDTYPEIYIGNKIYDAETGALLISDASISNQGASLAHNGILISSFAANIVGDAKTDLILGNEIYEVVITNRNGLTGNSITLSSRINPPAGIGNDGHAQVADFNLDGHLDVFISNKTDDYGNVGMYVWDVFNNTVSSPALISTMGGGKSIPLIADIDNDGSLEVIIQCNTSTGGKVRAYKYNVTSNSFSEMWDYEVDEDSYSNSMTAFDFNNNGNMELLLSDQSTIKILNGSGHSHMTDNDTIPVYTLTSLSFGECTVMQYPIVADVDADGSAEIVAVGLFGSGHTYQAYLNVFSSSGLPWAPARKVWNQYMYNVTNVNQDLTIPQQLFNNATPFTDPDGVVRRPFNNFLQQATTIDQYGRPFYAVPDAAALSADIIPSGSNSTLNITYTNQGDNTLNAPYYITVFANELGGAMMQSLTVDAPLAVGNTVQQSLVFSTYDLCQMPDLNSLVIVINCAGGGIAQNGNLQPECDIENNITQVSVNLQNEPINITEIACNQFVWHGETYTQSGQYEVTISNPYGCDTTFILNLTISDNYREEDRVSECDSYYWPRTQQWYYQSALDSVVIQSQQGVCDSTFVLDLTLHYSDTLNLEPVTVCEAFEWHGQTYAESGTYTYDTVNQYGCQTQYVLPLTISHSVEHEFSVTSCEPYEWYGTVYNEPGVYTQVLTGSQGCDSIVTLNLMVALSSESSIHGPTTIYASTDLVPGVYSYYIDSTGIDLSNVRWGIDREDWQLIPHGGSCDLLCMSDGQGILHVWTEGEACNMDTTMVLNAAFFGMGEGEASLRVYPNPTKGKLTVEWEEIQVINVYDLLGQKLLSCEYGKAQSCVLDLSHFRHSMYVLEIVSSTGRVIRPVVLTQ
ncbi:MAG: T9SS type A sorting domain-containing protein [Bacteroidales bacterium]|nr:T9SS type A sorting domain-containing protein [Bacteroidales bacterium]